MKIIDNLKWRLHLKKINKAKANFIKRWYKALVNGERITNAYFKSVKAKKDDNFDADIEFTKLCDKAYDGCTENKFAIQYVKNEKYVKYLEQEYMKIFNCDYAEFSTDYRDWCFHKL